MTLIEKKVRTCLNLQAQKRLLDQDPNSTVIKTNN